MTFGPIQPGSSFPRPGDQTKETGGPAPTPRTPVVNTGDSAPPPPTLVGSLAKGLGMTGLGTLVYTGIAGFVGWSCGLDPVDMLEALMALEPVPVAVVSTFLAVTLFGAGHEVASELRSGRRSVPDPEPEADPRSQASS